MTTYKEMKNKPKLKEDYGMFKCPSCGLFVPDDNLISLNGFPEDFTKGHILACSGCLEGWFYAKRLFNDKVATRSQIAKAQGITPPSGDYWDKPAQRREDLFANNGRRKAPQ